MSGAPLDAVCSRLERFCEPDAISDICSALRRWTPDVENALVNAERWLESYEAANGNVPDIRPELAWLLPTWASGSFLPRLMVRYPTLYDMVCTSEFSTSRKPFEAYEEELQAVSLRHEDGEHFNQALREYKQSAVFFIGARDLAGRLRVEDVTAELSSLAEASCDAAYRFWRRKFTEEYGEPINSSGAPAAYCALGMGKLGGGELNFSSDVDLIYLFEEDGETPGGTKGTTTNREFFTKVAQKMTASLNDVTPEGFVFRVDLRLRPEGRMGPLVVSLAAAESYYMNWGQTWERAALLKARRVAGSIELADEFLEGVGPWIHRRYLDYSTVEDIKLMKHKIDVSIGRTIKDAWDVKLGSGGIREIEFVVQTLILVHGGRNKQLRTRSTLQGLMLLQDHNLLTPGDAEGLAEAYRFLRKLEHRLQIQQERQTQRLPNGDETHLRLARLMGFDHEDGADAMKRFREDLEFHRSIVQDAFRKLFDEPGQELGKEIHPAVFAVTDGEGDQGERVALLESLGFKEPRRALDSMRRLVDTPQARHLDSKGRRYLERIMPRFLSECIAAPDPTMALTNLEDFIYRVGGWTSYHSLLAENPHTLKLLVRFFGTSTFLSKFFIRHPELLDQLVLASYATPLKDGSRMQAELDEALRAADGEEDELDVLRRYKNTEMLRIAINDVHGQLDLVQVTGQLAALADAILRSAVRLATDRIEERYGKPPEGSELVILGMGKFGGAEMNYSSDLDLIFIYTGTGDNIGPRKMTLAEYYGKMVQRLISMLTISTREGTAYPIDTRLRPSGNAGPLVTTMSRFEEYHRTISAIWERQALMKARVITGSDTAGEHVAELIEHAVFDRALTNEQIGEILRMRERMEKEIDPETPDRRNVKTGPGGIVDVEFFVQMMQLLHGGEYHSLRRANTFIALGELLELNLIRPADYTVLREGYLFLRTLENRMRLVHDNAKSTLSADPVATDKVAISLGYSRELGAGTAGRALLEELESHRQAIRTVFQNYFEKP